MSEALPAHIEADEALSVVWQCMNKIAPLSLADTSWDNVGVLLQAPEPSKNTGRKIFLANDLTTQVADEILGDGQVAVAIIYHPIIFRGLKTITLADSQQRTLLRLAAANISVYCPHTSLDATVGGINDWLALVVSGHNSSSMSVRPAQPSRTASVPAGHEGAGMGRIVTLKEPIKGSELIARVKTGTSIDYLQVALPSHTGDRTVQEGLDSKRIGTIAVCAGSGSSVIGGVEADAYVTGEMPHHEVLAAVAKNRLVILTHHSNSERGYLRTVLPDRLQTELARLGKTDFVVAVSTADADPLVTV